jgi:hypothetical protein
MRIRMLLFSSLTSRRQQKTNKKKFCLLLFEDTFTSFFKDKKFKRSHKTVRIKVFLSTTLKNAFRSGSGRPKNMWIRWISIRIRIWNTGQMPPPIVRRFCSFLQLPNTLKKKSYHQNFQLMGTKHQFESKSEVLMTANSNKGNVR